MHIYRLAIELGLIEAKYLDRRARHALVPTLSREETQRLQRLAADPNQWGCWASEIHASGTQLNRQYRSYSIVSVQLTPSSGSEEDSRGVEGARE